MTAQARRDDGTFEEQYDDEVFLDALQELDGAPSTQVAEQASELIDNDEQVTQITAWRRMQKFLDEGWVSENVINANTTLWELTDEGRAHLEELRDGEVAHAATTDAQDENNDASDTRRDDEQEGEDV